MGRKVDLSPLVPRFLERLDERLHQLDAAVETLASADAEQLEIVMRDFHSLAGIGGTYGFPEVTRLAREGELLITGALSEHRGVRVREVNAARLVVAQLEKVRALASV